MRGILKMVVGGEPRHGGLPRRHSIARTQNRCFWAIHILPPAANRLSQPTARCIIGKDYPGPIVDHATASKACISRMAAAYRASKWVAACAFDGVLAC